MNMTGSNGIFVVPAEHFPGLIALLATPVLLWAGLRMLRWRANGSSAWAARLRALPFAAKVAVIAMTIGATVHAAIVPTHWSDDRVLAVLFIFDTLGFVGASVWTILGRRHWAIISAAMLGGTVAGYAFYLAKGWETADVVGMTVSLIELSGFFALALAGHTAFSDPARRNWLAVTSLGAATAFVVGTVAATGTVATNSVALASSPVHAKAPMGAMGAAGSGSRQPSQRSSMKNMASAAGQPSGSTMPGMGTNGAATGANTSTMPGMVTTNSGAGNASNTMPGMPASPSSPGGGMGTMSSGSTSGTTGSGGGGMSGMGGSGGSTTPLSLATTSPAGNITWPLPMGAMGAGMQMVTPNCATEPNAAQQAAAVTLVDQTVSAVAPFQSLAVAKSAGYIPITPTGAPVVHYANPAYLASPQTLDPNAIESLVYANTPHGAILVAAMYAMANNQVGQMPPMPGGCLTEWHVHTNLCFSSTSGVVVGTEHNGSCPAGSVNHVTQPMIHVWLAPLPGGPLVVDAPDAQVVAAAQQLTVPNPPNSTA
jgi:hypothetical protein